MWGSFQAEIAKATLDFWPPDKLNIGCKAILLIIPKLDRCAL